MRPSQNSIKDQVFGEPTLRRGKSKAQKSGDLALVRAEPLATLGDSPSSPVCFLICETGQTS